MQHTVLQSLFVRLSVRLSVSDCLSDKHLDCDNTKETCVHILIPHERSFILVFWQEECLVGATLYLKCWAKLTLLERKRRFSIDIRS